MSAECSKCGHDLGYYGGCAVCTQRERTENAQRELAKLKDAITRALGVIQMWENAEDARSEANRILSNALADLTLAAPSYPEGDEEAVERVAKALYVAGFEDDPTREGVMRYRAFEWEQLADCDKDGFRKQARVAFAGFREPVVRGETE